MSKQNKIILVLIVVAVVIGGLYLANRYWIAPVTAARPQASSGKYPAAPDFSVTDIFGQKLNLADYRGKVVLLDFWLRGAVLAGWRSPALFSCRKNMGLRVSRSSAFPWTMTFSLCANSTSNLA